MSGSGLVYAAVLAAWGAYFVSRSVRSPAREGAIAPEGTVLRRRGAADLARGAYSVLRPPVEPEPPQVKPRQIPAATGPAPAPQRISRATARRRRRTLSVLALTLLVLGATALLGVLPSWAPGIPALLLLTYVVELRVQARRAAAPLLVVPVEERPAARRRGRLRKSDPEFWDPWPSFDPAERPKGASELANGWEPRPVPLPTYVTAAKAEEAPGTRRIDIAAGRPWIGAEPAAQAEPDAETRPMPFKPGDVVREDPAAETETESAPEFELKPAVGD